VWLILKLLVYGRARNLQFGHWLRPAFWRQDLRKYQDWRAPPQYGLIDFSIVPARIEVAGHGGLEGSHCAGLEAHCLLVSFDSIEG
jgi:hypothetical protein